MVNAGYLELDRVWRKGDVVELNLPMPVQRMAANPNVEADRGLLALQRGPIVYCLEQCDQVAPLDTLVLPVDAELNAEKEANLFGGVVVMKGFGQVAPEQDWQRKLYQPVAGMKRVPVKAIPYYAWDNRAPGAMKVWLPTTPPAPVAGGLETRARVTMSFANDNSQPQGINDGRVAKQSSDQPAANCHWWPHKGSDEWVQYTWTEPVTVSGARAFWFDDTGRGECRLPAAWRIEFLDGGEWRAGCCQRRISDCQGQMVRGRLCARKNRGIAPCVELAARLGGGRPRMAGHRSGHGLIMSAQYTIGLDYGTNSVRALIVNVANGAEVASAVWTYTHGTQGVILSRDPNLARQHPADYVNGAEITIKQALAAAKKSVRGFSADQVVGIGVDTTGSTPLPVDANGQPLAFQKKFTNHPAAMAWLWKDHTGVNEAAEITALAKKLRPQYLAKCGGTYSSEWFWSKILHCLRTAPEVFNAAHSWVEFADYVPAMLTGTEHPDKFIAGVCAAGHKAMWNANWGGYPDAPFLVQARIPNSASSARG